MGMRTLATALALAALALVPAAARAADVPPDATWTQAYFPSTDGVTLHADVLRPKGLPADARTPVVLSIGPYFNHSGQEGPADAWDPTGPSTGPSDRFNDFVKGAHLMQRGYTFVMVDLRGFGGSNGCLDWGGAGEQADVVESVKWAASQPWSTGAVGMYGKSYDAVTGLIGVDHQPPGLKAVVAQEPVYDLYRYLYGDGQRRLNSVATPALYDAIAETPGPAADDPAYNAGTQPETPGCPATNFADQAANDDHTADFWQPRNLIPGAAGSNVPLLMTQGLTEDNTVADGTAQFLRNHTGYERAWLGPWQHVRGNETVDGTDTGRLKMGRHGWFDEVMRFYDRFLKGETPAVEDPMVAVQTNDGKWRAEEQWPPADAVDYSTTLKGGTYSDEANNAATGSGAETGVWTISPPLPYDAHLAGSGRAVLDVSAPAPRANVVIDVYDLDKSGKGPLITRQGALIRQSGKVTLDLWSADWRIPAGHRIGVKVADTNTDWWALAAPTQQDVTVNGGTVTLPFLTYRRPAGTIEGGAGTQLSGYLADIVSVPSDVLASATLPSFTLPPALQEFPAGEAPSVGTPAPAPKAKAKKKKARAACASSKKKSRKKASSRARSRGHKAGHASRAKKR